ncbi:cache domain-containing protein [Tardiphaga sp. 866_E4_N2_1]|uniref:methyl-accepting chemotaxis protein n=1 Tax=unclassified Tardiphaga TaxID=2631404 RepID=UPI003F25577A
MLNRLSIRTKLWALVFAAAIGFCCVAAAALWFSYQRMYDDRIAKLKAVVEVGVSLAKRFETQVAEGKITREEAHARFKDALQAVQYSGQEYVFADTYDCVVFAHPNPTLQGKDISAMKDSDGQLFMQVLSRIARANGEGAHTYGWQLRPDDPMTGRKLAYVKDFAPWSIFIGTGVFINDIRADFLAMVSKVLGVMLALALPAIGLIAWVGASVSGRVRKVCTKMQALADGDLSIGVPEAIDGDEIGLMARTVAVFRDRLTESRRMQKEQEAAKARAGDQRRRDMEELARHFENAVGSIIETVSSAARELEVSADTMSATAERSQALAVTVTAASQEASSNVQAVASATEEMTSTVDEIARQVQGSAVIASEAVKQARMTDSRIARLAQAASRIGAVVELINTIAGQTNLLALNATIEAARAGDAGRGFAVVAAEVKTLAEQTAKATGEISAQVAEIQSATNESVISIKEISATIGRISEIASTIAAAVEQQGAATCEISRNVQQAAAGTTKVSHSIFEVRSGAGETGQASRRVLSAAKSLSDESGRLKSELGLFLDSVRAA